MSANVGVHDLLCVREQRAAGVGKVYRRVGLSKPLAACLEDGGTVEVGTAGPSGSPWPEREGYTPSHTQSPHILSVISNISNFNISSYKQFEIHKYRKSVLNSLDNAFDTQKYGLNNSSYCDLSECIDAYAFKESSERYVGESTYFMAS